MKITTLCYIEKNNCYLMLYRDKKENDQSQGKWLGVGGKLMDGECPDECVVRETMEETGLKLVSYRLRGFVTFVSDVYDDEMMFIYTADSVEGELNMECNEGTLQWVPKDRVLDLSLWEGDKIFLKELIKGRDNLNIKLVYEGDKLVEYVKY
ncbi:MAG: 8-oxo-dGTP diphosphatase [Lachnospiraceae bacterium]|nr:8-oxo-dGTP diphosphatase [Lachnospiraceae bacterium]